MTMNPSMFAIKKSLRTVENYKEDIIAEWHSYFDK